LEELLRRYPDVADDILIEAVQRYVAVISGRKTAGNSDAIMKEKEELSAFLRRNLSRASQHI
jgi:hypothetical protein